MQVIGVKLDSQKEFDLRVVDLVKETDTDV